MKPLTVGSLFSGIDGFGLGFEKAGCEIKWQVEIDPQARMVLRRHYPNTTIYEDIYDVGAKNLSTVDVVIGGFPCQGLSMAGQRKGLADERSGLWYQMWRVIFELKPTWVVIENVPGLFSSRPDGKAGNTHKGVDFAIVLAGLTGSIPTIPAGGWKSGGIIRGRSDAYNVCWRTLDAQYFRVPQRRRRVFLVGCLATTKRSPLEVLFERESSPWDPAPRREKGESFAAATGPLLASAGGTSRPTGNGNELSFYVPVVGALTARSGRNGAAANDTVEAGHLVGYARKMNHGEYAEDGTSSTLKNRDYKDAADLVYSVRTAQTSSNGQGVQENVAHTLDGTNGSVSEGVNPGKPDNECVYTAFPQNTRDEVRLIGGDGQIAGSLGAQEGAKQKTYIASTLSAKNEEASSSTQREKWYEQSAEMFGTVRRLTPIECERLQGFLDGWTAWGLDENGNQVEMKNAPRYRMLGNAVSVPVAVWIARRLVKEHKKG